MNASVIANLSTKQLREIQAALVVEINSRLKLDDLKAGMTLKPGMWVETVDDGKNAHIVGEIVRKVGDFRCLVRDERTGTSWRVHNSNLRRV